MELDENENGLVGLKELIQSLNDAKTENLLQEIEMFHNGDG